MSSRVISRRIVEAYAFLIYVKKYFPKKKKISFLKILHIEIRKTMFKQITFNTSKSIP